MGEWGDSGEPGLNWGGTGWKLFETEEAEGNGETSPQQPGWVGLRSSLERATRDPPTRPPPLHGGVLGCQGNRGSLLPPTLMLPRPRQGRGSMEGAWGRSCLAVSGLGLGGVSAVAAGASLQLHLICPWHWERQCGWNAEQHQGEGLADGFPVCPMPPPPPAETQSLCGGRETRNSFLDPGTEGREGRDWKS